MLKKLLLVSCLFVSINIQAQNADVRIGQLINESNWFELEHELKATPANSISPFTAVGYSHDTLLFQQTGFGMYRTC